VENPGLDENEAWEFEDRHATFWKNQGNEKEAQGFEECQNLGVAGWTWMAVHELKQQKQQRRQTASS